MFRFKICGITSAADVRMVADAGADAIGLNFYPPSARYVEPAAAELVISGAPESVRKIGLFVNADAAHVRSVAQSLGLDAVQLHGDEPPEAIGELHDLLVLKALRLGGNASLQASQYVDQCHRRGFLPAGWLIDSWSAGQYGGTGKTAPWAEAYRFRQQVSGDFVALAGGLTPANVAEAITFVRPSAVDVSSGVEAAPGKKDPTRVRAFVEHAMQAFERSRLSS